jgi:uncharacterized protein YhfF
MPKSDQRIAEFWRACQEAMTGRQAVIGQLAMACHRYNAAGHPEAWGFGDSPEMADELGQLVLSGTKTATCSLLWEYELEDEPVPQVGELSIVLDGHGEPLCLIETTEIRTRPYNKVEAQFAYDEGEGDRTLAFWRDAHWRFFSRQCDKLDLQVNEEMPLVCERFRVIYPQAGDQE